MATTRDPVECPHCGEPTQANRLADGTVVCSCAAERSLPDPASLLTGKEG
jgi:ribosomal protein L37AE/L43A